MSRVYVPFSGSTPSSSLHSPTGTASIFSVSSSNPSALRSPTECSDSQSSKNSSSGRQGEEDPFGRRSLSSSFKYQWDVEESESIKPLIERTDQPLHKSYKNGPIDDRGRDPEVIWTSSSDKKHKIVLSTKHSGGQPPKLGLLQEFSNTSICQDSTPAPWSTRATLQRPHRDFSRPDTVSRASGHFESATWQVKDDPSMSAVCPEPAVQVEERNTNPVNQWLRELPNLAEPECTNMLQSKVIILLFFKNDFKKCVVSCIVDFICFPLSVLSFNFYFIS